MSVHVALHHLTSYRYDRRVSLGPQTVRLRPAPHCRSRILSYSLRVLPEPHFINWQQDPQSNYLARLVFPDKTDLLAIEVDLLAEIAPLNPFDFFLEPAAEEWPFEYEPAVRDELAPYLKKVAGSPLFDAFVARLREQTATPVSTNRFLVGLNKRLSEEIHYNVRLEPGLQSPEQTLALRSGSCRDTGWLLAQVLRHLGFATRFVSGYLIQLTADEKPLEGPAGPSADFVDLHAWCEVYLPGAGWVGLDPTSGLLAGEGHLPLACTAEPSLAAPVAGLVDQCEATFEHVMKVTRIKEVPRVTLPYSERQWEKVLAVGEVVDADLLAGDARLTMGGEPTFTSIDDWDGAEWNTAALGPNKRRLAELVFQRLKERYAPQGLVQTPQGKWYPGEPLPRWSLNLYFRADGEPLWSHPNLLADPSTPVGSTTQDARKLLTEIAARLGVGAEHVAGAHEDIYYYLWRERRLPINVDPTDPKLDEPLERDRLRKLFTEGIGREVGCFLPLTKLADKQWRSGPWHFRGGHCLLVPGDSPMGLRLPLDSQPWVDPADRAIEVAADPTRPLSKLPPKRELISKLRTRSSKPKAAKKKAPRPGESARELVRTAMCVQPRDGVLYVFMPPVETADDFVELAAAIESAAEAVGVPVALEGYTPPRDARLVQLSVTPDPGVVEVNIHPASSWQELVERTLHLYETAKLSRLAAEKFMPDGRHVGTGGGNHFVLGGPTPNDSPFLRRPDLLRSFVAYFHQHPSLSFLFSGLFIGPTSQAPRLDEARNDSLFEMEIAFREVSRALQADEPRPWLTDRLFRDLLVDVTGNTHRAEFCIDKLYSPDSATGRLGLVELRAFEMPPHPRMSLTQQLLLRALVARFWKTPYSPERLTRWGTQLHDRFMLPHFVWMDFEEVLRDLVARGYALEAEWFVPHFEFRFPRIGDFSANGVQIELRSALEPWHVMGEDTTPGGTARYVDSSLERIEVKATGLPGERYRVTCNGQSLPLRDAGRAGELVAGVRYRAWKPPRCLHPHIDVHTPLTFDLFDTWTGRSLGGCQYHVSHPGGRAYDTRPVNALEAGGRRRARFFRMGHTPDAPEPAPPTINPDFPFTLDLRDSSA